MKQCQGWNGSRHLLTLWLLHEDLVFFCMGQASCKENNKETCHTHFFFFFACYF